MKRLIFCFDGTWNRIDALNPTNVVHTANNIASIDKNGIPQIVYYDEGVGTKKGEKWRGGIFGKGLLENIADAYRFLVFNYDVGDEIYIFGFSRGAFSARSFGGLILHSGIVSRLNVKSIPEAVVRYSRRKKDADHMRPELLQFRNECSPHICVDEEEYEWRLQNNGCTAKGNSSAETETSNDVVFKPHILRIKYIGVWDTVGSLGIPKSLSISYFVNKKHQFHDANLSGFVTSARHAVAIDEQRKSFEPTVWENIDEMNLDLGFAPSSADAPYQQKWFPGVHGAVGGGGDHTGLSDEALDWVLQGAKDNGLEFTADHQATLYQIGPDHCDYLNNSNPPEGLAIMRRLMNRLPKRPRENGRPQHLHQVSMSTRYRWKEAAKNLRPEGQYRPQKTLDLVSEELDNWNLKKDSVIEHAPGERKIARGTYTVKRGDTLGEIAQHFLGDKKHYTEIFELNRPMLTDPNRIYPGQVLIIPESLSNMPENC